MRQNDFMVLENGEPGIGTNPRNFTRFQDNILRSYLSYSEGGRYICYIWTTFTPPNILATILKQWGFENVMLLDIHPVIAAKVIAPPSTHLSNTRNLLSNFYHFVPQGPGISKKFQWNPEEGISQNGAFHDFIAVFAKH